MQNLMFLSLFMYRGVAVETEHKIMKNQPALKQDLPFGSEDFTFTVDSF